MPYKKSFRGKRARRVVRKRRTAKKPSVAIKRYVNRAIHRQIENKGVAQSVAKTMSNISNLANFQSGNMLQLTPSVATNYLYTISQGTGAGARTGNQVKLRSAILRFALYPQAYNAVSNPTPKPQDVIMYILSGKRSVVCNTVADLATILNTNCYKLGSSSSAMLGNLYDVVSAINNDVLTCHLKRVFKLSASNAQLQSGATAAFSNNDYKINHIKTINVTKFLPKTFIFDDANNNSVSKQVFAVFCPVNSDGTGTISSCFPCSIFAGIDVTFEDA